MAIDRTNPSVASTGTGLAGSLVWRRPEIVVELLRLYQELMALPTLSPNARTNAVFSELVRVATYPGDSEIARQVLADAAIRRISPGLRNLCAEGEVELERAWARRIAASSQPWRDLAEFPYFANYQRLTRLEHYAVLGVAECAPVRLLFVGAGPLPLTSLLLASQHGHTEIDNIDIDSEAVRLAQRLAGALGIASLRFRCADVLDCGDLAGYDLVYVAAMVGPHRGDKSRVVEHLYRRMRPGALLLARSAHSLRTLLYPPLALRDLAGFRPLIVLDPHTEVVNSLVIAEKPSEVSGR
ncbi:MAG TPA: nicotianamine synthase family protein [Pseudonocardia sp.]|jgi:nicotianamine synthase|uniref:nicotianamine synthase family protein n=1 Tax=Pseudonocardia sp. TaxID=60912 RepID=UPI002F42C827